jgi:hypothetical protein
MSGGYFNYDQYRISDMANSIREDILSKNSEINQYYSEYFIEKLKEVHDLLIISCQYAQRADWVLSGDDNESDFDKRLNEDLDKLVKPQLLSIKYNMTINNYKIDNI